MFETRIDSSWASVNLGADGGLTFYSVGCGCCGDSESFKGVAAVDALNEYVTYLQEDIETVKTMIEALKSANPEAN